MRNTLPAKLIVVEGIDGAGKSTLLTNLEAALAAELPVRRVTKSTVASAHPSLTGYLTRLNDLLYKREDGVGALLGERYWLFAMASWYTALYEQVIQPTLADGVHVLLDNSPYKLVARMLVGSDVDADLVRACYAGLREPDLTVLLDVSPEVALARKQGHSTLEAGHDTSENAFVSHQNNVRQQLVDMAGQHDWLVMDVAEADPAQLLREVIPAVHRVLHGQPASAGCR